MCYVESRGEKETRWSITPNQNCTRTEIFRYGSKDYAIRFSNQKTKKRISNHQAKGRRNYPRPTLVKMLRHAQQRTAVSTNHQWIPRPAHVEEKDPLGCDILQNGCSTFVFLITNHACINCLDVLILGFFFLFSFPPPSLKCM